MAAALADSNSTPLSSLSKLVQLAGLSEDAMKNVTINGPDPVWPTRYKVVNPGAAVMAATGVAAADLWALEDRPGVRTCVSMRVPSPRRCAVRGICASTARSLNPIQTMLRVSISFGTAAGSTCIATSLICATRNVAVLGTPREARRS